MLATLFTFAVASVQQNGSIIDSMTYTSSYPGAFAPMPTEGYRSLRVDLPSPSPLSNVTLYTAHVMLDLNTFTIPGMSPAVPFVLP